MKKEKHIEVQADVISMNRGVYKCVLDNGYEVLARRASKLNINKVRVMPGDRCLLHLSPYNLKLGRIVYRL